MIRFHFKKGGKVEVAPQGYPGQTCHTVSDAYTRRMAGDISSSRPTEEAEQEPVQNTQQQQEQV